jgi:hypothetical protein
MMLRDRVHDFEGCTERHWDGESQRYAGVDQLITSLLNGWDVDDVVLVEKPADSSAQVYHFCLRRADTLIEMPVLANPHVERIITHMKLVVLDASLSVYETVKSAR